MYVPFRLSPRSDNKRSGLRRAVNPEVEPCCHISEDPSRRTRLRTRPGAFCHPLQRVKIAVSDTGHPEWSMACTFWLSLPSQVAPDTDLKSAIERLRTTRVLLLVSL